MAKFGIEVEGKLKGSDVRTLFLSAEEYINHESVFDDLADYECDMIYISDHLNQLCLHDLAEVFDGTGYIVTVELTQLTEDPPDQIQIFWNVSQASYAQASTIKYLRHRDQIKIENDLTVFSFLAGDAIVTLPQEFSGDIEV